MTKTVAEQPFDQWSALSRRCVRGLKVGDVVGYILRYEGDPAEGPTPITEIEADANERLTLFLEDGREFHLEKADWLNPDTFATDDDGSNVAYLLGPWSLERMRSER